MPALTTALASGGAAKLIAMVGAGWLLMQLGRGGKSQSGGAMTDAAVERMIDASERNNPNVENARFQMRQAVNSHNPNTMLQLADVLATRLGMPRTAQNLRAHANHVAAYPPSSAGSSSSGGAAGGAGSSAGGAPSSSTLPGVAVPPADVISMMATALASGNPATYDACAATLEARGYPVQARDMRAAAAELRKAQAAAAAAGASTAPPLLPVPVLPQVTPTGGISIPSPVAAGAINPRQMLASKLVIALNAGHEDKELVRLFQTQELETGRYDGKPDGLYGPKSALAIAAGYNIVPPKPLHWPRLKTKESQDSYRKLMLAKAQQDTARAEEWIRAAKVP